MKSKTTQKPALSRCDWCGEDALYQAYHDDEWGVPVFDGEDLFAKLILDGAQAGLAWITILRKREGYYQAFDGLNPYAMAQFDDKKISEIMANPGVVRNRLKINSAVNNARAYVAMTESGVDFADFLWQFVDGKPIQNRWRAIGDVPVTSPEAQAMSKALKKQGFSFVGPTIIYAFMQAVGMVNDHLLSCHRHPAVARMVRISSR